MIQLENNTFSPLIKADIPLYMQVYAYYKALITEGKLPPHTKLPSVRRCADSLSVSRTTAEAAYFQLCADGYIVAKPKSGYYVTDLYFRKPQKKSVSAAVQKPEIRFDLSAVSADRQSFDFTVWRRYLKSALRQDDRLLSYGAAQGEPDLREAVAQYITEKRNVACTPDSIVIGAGVQSLLHILCGILRSGAVFFQDTSFLEGTAIFEDHGFSLTDVPDTAQYIYTAPSHCSRFGDVMPVSQRLALLRYAAAKDVLIIEDDYDNEFSYADKPTPALQGLDGGHRVVYLGTFSKLLLPSIRLSFMVLPDPLLPAYRARAARYNQTASKAEQIALCQFIRDGHLASQTRKVRRIYAQKAEQLAAAVRTVFGSSAEAQISDTGVAVRVRLRTACSAEAFMQNAAAVGLAVRAADTENGCMLLLSCTGVQTEDYMQALQLLQSLIT